MQDSDTTVGLRIWFAGALILGIAGMVGGWLLSWIPLLSGLLTVAVPLGAMAAYVIAAYASDRSTLVTVQFADSVYYLGFLFTLIALSVSLLSFTGGEYHVPDVATRFGVALLTTVAGLSCRIYLVNFRTPVDDSLAQTEDALAQAGEELRRKLDQLSRDMTVQSKLMNDSLRGAIDLTAAELKAVAETGRSTVETSARAMKEALGAAAQEMESSTRLGSESIRSSLDDLAERVREAGLPADLFTSSLLAPVETLARELHELGNLLQSSHAGHRQLAAATAALTSATEPLRQAGMDLSSTLGDVSRDAQRLSEFAQSLDGVAQALGRVESGLSDHQELVRKLRLEAERDGEVLTSHRAKLRENLEESQMAIEQVRGDLVAAAAYIREELGGGDPRP